MPHRREFELIDKATNVFKDLCITMKTAGRNLFVLYIMTITLYNFCWNVESFELYAR